MDEAKFQELLAEIQIQLQKLQTKSTVVELAASPEFYWRLCTYSPHPFRTILAIPVSVNSFLPKSVRLRFVSTNGSTHDWHGNEDAAAA